MPDSIINDPRHWLALISDTLKASPLYTTLWEQMQHDEAMLALVDLVNEDQPNLVTFFTAINYLVLAGPHHPFAQFYPSLHGEATPPLAEAYPIFCHFVQEHQEELQTLLPGARLQTNEVTRCSNLLPAFFLAYQRGGHKPLHMIELGSSAGLNLLWQQSFYQYERESSSDTLVVGERSSLVHLHCTLEGSSHPPLPTAAFPVVANCQGIEVLPRDIYNEEDMRWVRAAIWPEEVSRYALLDTAIMLAQRTPMRLHRGDACELLPSLLAAIPDDQTALIWHSFALNQGPIEIQKRILQHIAEASHRIPLYRVSLEFLDQAGPKLELYEYQGGVVVRQEVLAWCAVHGERMKWLLQEHLDS